MKAALSISAATSYVEQYLKMQEGILILQDSALKPGKKK